MLKFWTQHKWALCLVKFQCSLSSSLPRFNRYCLKMGDGKRIVIPLHPPPHNFTCYNGGTAWLCTHPQRTTLHVPS